MIPARVQKIKLMDLAFNPVQLSVEVLDRRCVTLLKLVGQKSAIKFTFFYIMSDNSLRETFFFLKKEEFDREIIIK